MIWPLLLGVQHFHDYYCTAVAIKSPGKKKEKLASVTAICNGASWHVAPFSSTKLHGCFLGWLVVSQEISISKAGIMVLCGAEGACVLKCGASGNTLLVE
jgi:hypothetical protein